MPCKILYTIKINLITAIVVIAVSSMQPKIFSNNKAIEVKNETQLANVLQFIKEGTSVVLLEGVYKGKFVVPFVKNASDKKRIFLVGKGNVVIDGGDVNTGYALHILSSYCTIENITITNALKGIMVDSAQGVVIKNTTVHGIGEEGIHLRKYSSHNTISHCTIYNTGLKKPDYGEGIYIGTAVSNWPKYTNGLPDTCNYNLINNNTIGPNCTAECIDVKEGTSYGIISNNNFNSTGITGANSGDSWMDVKGNNYIINNNKGFNPQGTVLQDGYQVNVAVNGWGNNNVFKHNTSEVNANGFAINIRLKSSKGEATGNIVFKNNTATNAKCGITNINVTE
jgi:hypothetical protein